MTFFQDIQSVVRIYYACILASRSRALYIGVTGDLLRTIREHRTHVVPRHTNRYRVTRLVHFEVTEDALSAIVREKQLKSWRREKKITLLEASNPTWGDLAADWFR